MLMWDFGLRYPDAGIGAADTSTTRRPVGSGPSSWCPSSRNAPAARGTSTATRTSAPPPNDVACDPSIGRTTSSPHRSGGCGDYSPLRLPPRDRGGCRTPCPGSGSAPPPSDPVARPRSPRSSPSRAAVRRRWPRRSRHPAARRRRRSAGSSWSLSYRGRWDSCPSLFPPNRALPRHASAACHCQSTPPSSSHAAGEDPPDPLHDAAGGPALEPVVDGALGPELAGELVPLAAAAHPEDDAIEHLSPVGDPPSGRLLGPELPEDGLDLLPERVRDLPDGRQWLGLRLSLGLRLPLGRGGGHRWDPPEYVYVPL